MMKDEKTNIVNGVLVMPKKGTNAYWLWEQRNHQSDECLWWPFSKNEYGYGQVGYERTIWKAHKLMCSFVHGERRYPAYEVRHTCGHGQDGCVNPRHLIWGNRSQNGLDKKEHGYSKQGTPRYKLTPDQVAKIRTLEGTDTLANIAAFYKVSRACIWQIWRGQTWQSLTEGQGQHE